MLYRLREQVVNLRYWRFGRPSLGHQAIESLQLMTFVVSVFDNHKEQITQVHPYLFSDLDIIKEE